jgi:hypothetical protein
MGSGLHGGVKLSVNKGKKIINHGKLFPGGYAKAIGES